MCLWSTQPLHSAASAIVAKLHRLLKIEHPATLRAISPALFLSLALSGEKHKEQRRGGQLPVAHFPLQNKLMIETEESATLKFSMVTGVLQC